MKKISLLFTIVLLASIAYTQVPPQAFNYSAVARNASNNPIANTTIGIQISILKTNTSGTVVYKENHFVNTDQFGLFNLTVGQGAVQSGSMTTIDWSADSYYLKVGLDATGGTNFVTMGTTQLLSVPYALYAKSSTPTVINAGTNVTITGQGTQANPYVVNAAGSGGSGGNFTHYIGEQFGGGVIFHLWKDAQGVEHGLIVDITDLSTAQVWSNIQTTLIGASAQSSWDGLSNSNAIVGQAGHTSSASAAALCLNSTNGGQSDWYLPSIDELSLLWHSRFNVNKSLSAFGGATVLPNLAGYWSSSEYIAGNAWYFGFLSGSASGGGKGDSNYVRAVRAF
jgi:hypothetical protein